MTTIDEQARSTPSVWTSRPNAPPSGQRLARLETIPENGAREFIFGSGLNTFRMFIVRKGENVFGYLNLCPHYSLPLNHRPDEFLNRDGSKLMCRQHLALFDIETGACLDGAAEGRSLDPVPLVIDDGMVRVG